MHNSIHSDHKAIHGRGELETSPETHTEQPSSTGSYKGPRAACVTSRDLGGHHIEENGCHKCLFNEKCNGGYCLCGYDGEHTSSRQKSLGNVSWIYTSSARTVGFVAKPTFSRNSLFIKRCDGRSKRAELFSGKIKKQISKMNCTN